MNNVGENENEKGKEDKKEEEETEESDEDYEAETLEAAEEGSHLEEISLSENDLPSDSGPTHPSVSESESQSEHERSARDSYIERRALLVREKWLSVVGRKPRSVPTVKKCHRGEEEDMEKIVFFGDRRPMEIEKKRREKWMKLAAEQVTKPKTQNYGRIKQEFRLPALSEGLMCVRFETNGESLATCYRNGGLQVRKITGDMIRTLRAVETADKLPLRGLRYHPKEPHTLYVGGAAGVAQIFDIETGELLGMSDYVKQINNLDVSVDGYTLVTVGRNGCVCVLDCFTLEVISVRERPNLTSASLSDIDDEYHRMRVYGLKFHPFQANIFLTGAWDRTIKIWDVRTPTAVLSIRGPFVTGDGIDIKDNKILSASWSSENSIDQWDIRTGGLIKTIPLKTRSTVFDGEFLYAARYFNDFRGGGGSGTLIAVGGSGFNEALVINTDTEETLVSLPSYKAILSLDTTANLVAYGGKESLLRIGEVILPGHRAHGGEPLHTR